eukprot:TRINITY_DN21414_c0_g1_i1.p1 TRINITY_DN21414_c0_g1~~TRINITY_DN21414_c0_g1_i1.p1  ORF type:complete len:686 (+),score=183.90 TRINITY_DN21414_c0_g1_i1:94-2151(+)
MHPSASGMFSPTSGVRFRRNDRSKRVRGLDFLSSWPVRSEGGTNRFLAVALVTGFFFGPICAPCLFCLTCCNRLLKANRTGFDLFGVMVVVQLQIAMFVMLLNTACVTSEHLCLGHRPDGSEPSPEAPADMSPSGLRNASRTDQWGPLGCYVVTYCWLATVLARHIACLTGDAYNPLPPELRRLQGIFFHPPLKPTTAVLGEDGRLEADAPLAFDVPELVGFLTGGSTGQKMKGAAGAYGYDSSSGSEEGAQAAVRREGDVRTALEFALMTMQRGSTAGGLFGEWDFDDDEDAQVPSEQVMDGETNWAMNLLIGVVLSTIQISFVRFAVASNPPRDLTDQGRTIYWLSTTFWWMMFSLMWAVIVALVHIYARLYRSMASFTVMTDVHEATRKGLPYFDVSSTKNIILWFEARTFLVDQVVQPTSFLRAIFDPTCVMLGVTLVFSVAVLIYRHLVTKTRRVDELSAGIISLIAMSGTFFFVIVMYTRWIARAMLTHNALLALERRRIVAVLTLSAEGVVEIRGTFQGATMAGRSAAVPMTQSARYEPLASVGTLSSWCAKRELQATTGQDTRPLLWMPESGCSAAASEDYLVPHKAPQTDSPATPLQCGNSRVHHRRPQVQMEASERARLLRRLHLVESMSLHITHCTQKPRILGYTLDTLLQLFVVAMLVLATLFAHLVRDSGWN